MNFPKVLFVEQKINKDDNYDGYESFDDLPGDTVIGVYELRRIAKVRENCTKTLKDLPMNNVSKLRGNKE